MSLRKTLLRFGAVVLAAYGEPLAFPQLDHYASEEVQGWMEEVVLTDPVTIPGGDSTSSASWGGAFPTSADDFIVPHGVTLTIKANDSVALHFMKLYGHLVIEQGTGGFETVFQVDTLLRMRGSTVTLLAEDGGRVRCPVDDSSPIDLSKDPHMITRGWIGCGEIVMKGKPRQFIVPCSNDIVGGATTVLNLTRTPFVGFNGASGAANDPFNYSAIDLDWQPGEKIVLLSRKRRNTLDMPSGAEIAQIGAADYSAVSATPFSAKDTTGCTITLSAPAVTNHLKYYDPVAVAHVVANFGPPPESPTFGSHGAWFEVPWLVNYNRNIKFTRTTPGSPAHHRPHFMYSSSATILHYVEFIGWGRSNILADTVIEGTEDALPLLGNTNLRHRDAVHAYDAGLGPLNGLMRDGFSAELVGVAVWDDGPVGETMTHETWGAGSCGFGFEQYRSSVYYEGCITHNTLGAGFRVSSSQDSCVWRHTIVSEVWGEAPEGPSLPLFKDLDDYSRGDVGRDGSGYHSSSRIVLPIRTIASGCAGFGRVVLARSPLEEVLKLDARWVQDGPESVGYHQFHWAGDDNRPALKVEGDYFFANRMGGSLVSKGSPIQNHGHRSYFLNCFYTLGETTCKVEYTGQYVMQNMACLGPELESGLPVGTAFELGTSVHGFTNINHYYANFAKGIDDHKEVAGLGPMPDAAYPEYQPDNHHVDFHTPRNVADMWRNVDVETEVLTIGPENYGNDFGFNITGWAMQPGNIVRFFGTARDAIGEYPLQFSNHPSESNGVRIDIGGIAGALSNFGYWTDPAAPDWRTISIPYSGRAPYYSQWPIAVDSRLPVGMALNKLRVLAPLGLTSPPPTSNRWVYPSGKPYLYENHGAGDFNAAMAAANVIANNGQVFP